ncbi:MAG: AGE family epimerase/isomerase [Treponema sp.]|nr:AGE family epimerase/isomerase [Treponema sp.]
MTEKITEKFDKKTLAQFYKKSLVHDELAFWLKYGIDKKYGGICTGLDRNGNLLETDKSIWFQGRALWTFANAYKILSERGEKHSEYLEACQLLADFIEKHATDKSDGRMYFRVTADGKPVVKRLRYYFSETFAVIGFAAFARASGKTEYAQKAFELFNKIEAIRMGNVLVPKFNPNTRPSRGFGEPMILLNTLAELRLALPEKQTYIESYIDTLLYEIKKYFVKPELKAVLEQCATDGSVQHEHFEGRLLNPGHAIEGSWFIMKEGLLRNNEALQKLGVQMFDWMWERGWDKEYGGIIYYRDIDNKPGNEYWHDMKFWWPQCEAIIASLYAYKITHDDKYLDKFASAHNYFNRHFPDEEYGEYFGYFHRDGTLSTPVKGNMYKGPFHIPRMHMECMVLCETI